MKNCDVLIIGAGPAGIFTALELTKIMPDSNIILIDSGSRIDNRKCPLRNLGKCIGCNPCNIMSGWAGAGAFSDGKLSLSEEVGGNITDYMPINKAHELIKYADSIYLNFGAPNKVHGLNDKKVEEIAYQASRNNIRLIRCPVRHMGTENGFNVLKEMYNYLSEQNNFTFLELSNLPPIIPLNVSFR